MFFKALGGSMVAVFGGFYAFGMFDPPQTQDGNAATAVDIVRRAEIADNQRSDSAWGPQCNGLRDKLMGAQGGVPIGMAGRNGLESITKLNKAERELRKAGCDIDKAPGAFSPFEPDKGQFRTVKNAMDGDIADESEWGGDPNAFNDSSSDDWGQ